MSQQTESGPAVVERVFNASLDLVWELWTTPEGLSSWWGPPGFAVDVHEMDLVVGGTFEYTMNAGTPEMAKMMQERGRPASFTVAATYTQIQPKTAYAYESPMGPDDKLMTSVQFAETSDGVAVTVSIDASKPGMAGGASMGWKGSLDKFAERLESAR